MKKLLKFLLGFLLLLVIGGAIAWFGFLKPKPPPISPEDRAAIHLMPLPASLSLNGGKIILNAAFNISFSNISSPRLEKAVDRFKERLESQGLIYLDSIGFDQKLIIDCKQSTTVYPKGDEDESYSLNLKGNNIHLSAPTELGVLHGLETILQLADNQGKKSFFPTCEITDSPRYPWRGLMIDACRHWIPKEVILRNIDGMAAVKMNVLHWHLSEYQGFRVESKVFPKLHEMGSEGHYYTQEEIKEVVDYAAERGIRVIPEFDLPGHATSWFVGYPELASAPGPYELANSFGVLLPLLDPTREDVYDFLDKFFGEMATLFPDPYIHIGGDEINPTHWNENPDIQQFIEENELEDHHGLQAYFNRRLKEILTKHGKKMMGWDEILHPDLPKEDITVQSWRSQESLWEAARGGNKAVLSTGYYLDHQLSAASHYQVDPTVIPNAVNIEIDSSNWKSWRCVMEFQETEFESDLYLFGEGENLRGIITSPLNTAAFENAKIEGSKLSFKSQASVGELTYNVEMIGDSLAGEISIAVFSIQLKGKRNGGSDMAEGIDLPEFAKIEPLTPEQETNLLGGEACIWSEMVNGHTIDSRIWPRIGAIAERLWSPGELANDNDDMYRRLMWLDEYILTRGIQHLDAPREIISDMVPESYVSPLTTLVDVLQESKVFGRMSIYQPLMYTTSPLNRVVDAARPESYVVYRFGQAVDEYLANPDDEKKSQLIQQLNQWAINHQKLLPAFETVERLQEVKSHSENLSRLANLGLEALNGKVLLSAEEKSQIFQKSDLPSGGTFLAVSPHIQKLIE
ncbi:MAG: family 20 glycosylhydrolase [Bacteroidetes bacterium]|nr:family 20 glycosylhydrolase [Bacteroidota bacterium]